MVLEDDRSSEEKKTHTFVVIGLDSFMTRLGPPTGGKSYAGWACESKHADKVTAWVRARGDITRLRSRFPRGVGHCHVYVVNEGHPALEAKP